MSDMKFERSHGRPDRRQDADPGHEDQGRPQQKQRQASAPERLPDVLYRLKIMHSSETFFGYYEHAEGEWPHFRTFEELDELLEGPSHPGSEQMKMEQEGPASAVGLAAPAEASAPEPTDAPTGGEPPAPEDAAAQDTVPAADPGPAGNSPSAAPGPSPVPGQRIRDRALVVAPTKYGKDIVEVQGLASDTSFANPDELVRIERPAGLDDLRRLKENEEREKSAYVLCRDKIWAKNLPMKLVSAHYLLEEPKILFYFTAESRVDFRELVKDLVSTFKTRIELRQIGVRDEARVTGGVGVCGRILCCHGISDRLNPVSIKMAKDQNLSLNSLKISGPCGRLLCCLSYEHQFYRDARRELPQEGVKFVFDGTLFKVVEVNALGGTVKLSGEDGRVLDMRSDRFRYSEGRWRVIEE